MPRKRTPHGKGRQVKAANETAVALDVAAEFHDLTQTAAVPLTNTASANWGAVAVLLFA